MNKLFLASGSGFAAVAVILGAFGAHALRSKLAPDQLNIFETGVKYQMYHALALILCGVLYEKFSSPALLYSGYFFLAGIFLFSGSVYLLSMRSQLGIEGWKFLGPVTPLGGACFVAGWIMLLISIIKK